MERALMEYLMRYGFKREVETLLGNQETSKIFIPTLS